MIYTDGTHLVTDGPISELHKFAQKIGLKKNWFQDHPAHPHFDIWGKKVKAAINQGARFVSAKEIVHILNRKKSRGGTMAKTQEVMTGVTNIFGDCLATGKAVTHFQCRYCYALMRIKDVLSWETCRKYNLLRRDNDD